MTARSGVGPGSSIGSYRIDELLGVGGMGEVYRAQDAKLRRAVAIKILPPSLGDDPARLARFEREARLLASLNHPRIAAIFGLENAGGRPALVLELVEGPLLAERIARGPLRVDDAIAYAVQIAEGIEAAHERGIVHRDLKPSNIKLTSDGAVKILDFGIAKVLAPDDAPALEMTRTTAETAIGTIVGTPLYMSPEQATGQPIDKRSDIWAFGCVLFEMLTGRKAFDGKSPSAILASILERAPDWTALPSSTPEQVRWVLHRCLEKDPRERLRDIGEARVALTRPRAADGATPTRPYARAWIGAAAVAAVAFVAAAYALGVAVGGRRGAAAAPTAERLAFAVPPPANHLFGVGLGPAGFAPNAELVSMAVAPDGSQLAFIASNATGRQIWLRQFAATEPRPVEGTDGAISVFWSPDGRSIGFVSDARLKRIDLPDGRPITICDVPPNTNLNPVWGRDVILYATLTQLFHVPAAGGTPVLEVEVDRAHAEVNLGWPWFLPDGRHYFYTVRYRNREGTLRLGQIGSASTPVMPLISNVQWVDPDLMVFVRDGRLLTQRFDLERRAAIGEPTAVADQIQYGRSTSRANFASSRSGVIVYQSHLDEAELVWVSRDGKETKALKDRADYTALRLNADGQTALVSQSDPRLGTYDIWSIDLARAVRQRVTFDPTSELLGAWIPRSNSFVFSAERDGPPHLFTRNLTTGEEREVRPAENLQVASDVTPDGREVLYAMRDDKGSVQLWTAPLATGAATAFSAKTPYSQFDVRFAPNGDSVVFSSTETGRTEVYAASMPNMTGRVPISSGGGAMARWSADGGEIFYVSPESNLMAVPVISRSPIRLGAPTVLFALGGPWRALEVAPDGRFLAIIPRQLGNAQPLTAILNWTRAPAPTTPR